MRQHNPSDPRVPHRRRLVTLICALTLTGIWGASQFRSIEFGLGPRRLISSPGNWMFMNLPKPLGVEFDDYDPWHGDSPFAWPPVNYIDVFGTGQWSYDIAHWPVVLIAWMTVFLVWRPRSRSDDSRCIHCNYSLTGNQSGKCPECGTTIAPINTDEVVEDTQSGDSEASSH